MDYDKAADYWKTQDACSVKADRDTVKAEIEKFISAHNTCALATGFGTSVRCTPLEYTYFNDCFFILSEGGEKFRALKENKNVCLAVFDTYNGFNGLGGMQISGKAQLIEPWSDEYIALLNFKKISEEALRKLSHPMYMIKIKPEFIDFLSSDFKKIGCSSRQSIKW